MNGAKPILMLPDGSPVPVSVVRARGRRWLERDQRALKCWEYGKKQTLPQLGLWRTRSQQKLIAADFDKLPVGYSCFDSLYQDLVRHYGSKGIVTRTHSKKCKVFFVVAIGAGEEMTAERAEETLGKLLTDAHYEAVDRSPSALSSAFIPDKETCSVLEARLGGCPVLEAAFSPYPTCVPGTLRTYTGGIDNVALAVFAQKSALHEKLLRILLATPKLAEGVALHQNSIVQSLECSRKPVVNLLADLRGRGWLLRPDRAYFRDWRSQVYRAQGPLLVALIALAAQKKAAAQLRPLPARIENGKSRAQIWDASWHFINSRLEAPEDFLAWARNHPDIRDREDRLEHVETAIRLRLRYRRPGSFLGVGGND